jgi:general secretion pathway protein F
MPTFQYKAVTETGQSVAGMLAGPNEQAVLADLETRRLTPVSLALHKEGGTGRIRIGTRQISMSYQQMADLLKAGVPLLRALRLLGGRKSAPKLAAVFRELADSVADGEELCDAMAKRPEVFSKIHVAMVRAGEKGGFLEEVLARLGQLLLRQADMRSKVIGSLIYPILLVILGLSVLTIVFAVFVPMFEPMFETLDRLPTITLVVFAVAELVSTYAPITGLVGFFVFFGLWRLSKRPDVSLKLAKIKVRTPIIGPLTRAIATARFCRVLGTLLGNSIPVLTAMSIARDASGNVLMESAVDAATDAVRGGEPLSPPLEQSGLFGDDVVEMIAVGESANNLDEVLLTIAETIESRIDRLLSGAVRLIEPLLLVVLGAVIAVVAAALLLPILQLSQSIGS